MGTENQHLGDIVRESNSAGYTGDIADQADRLTMIMQAEATRNSLNGNTGYDGGEGSLEGFIYPLEDTEQVVSDEDASDSSDDSWHAGGVHGVAIKSPEVDAMHIIPLPGDANLDVGEQDPNVDPYSSVPRPETLTSEDRTLLGRSDPDED